MSSRTIIYYLYAWFFLLALNIWGYYGSSAYRNFIDTLKYGDTPMVTDEITPAQEKIKSFSTWVISMTWTTAFPWKKTIVSASGSTNATGSMSWIWTTGTMSGGVLSLSPEEEVVLNAFKDYKLKRLLVHPSLFDMTTEFPDDYFEYYSENLTLYIFPTKNYKETVSIFEAFATELPFLLNKTDSIGTNSFFINVKPEFQDDYVRIVFEYKQKVFWLKIKKDEYNTARNVIKNIR